MSARLRRVVRAREVPIAEKPYEFSARYVLTLECGHETGRRLWWDRAVKRARAGEPAQVRCTECTS